ncbi:hypothetical protein [Actinomadura fibrosa]|uniref:Uncharacterized protein n=1 Tax=Actinomadura fibrosa TaxID=111802 RepID=A0ABW2Y076_9ACTN|nr:hypothetical protein [Actinomadura fibrosa]
MLVAIDLTTLLMIIAAGAILTALICGFIATLEQPRKRARKPSAAVPPVRMHRPAEEPQTVEVGERRHAA